MKLSIRISLILAAISMLISLVFASVSYVYQLERITNQSTALVLQLAQGAQRPSAIASYVEDEELASEILAGIVNNDLIKHASIRLADGSVFVKSGSELPSDTNPVRVELFNPFMDNDKVGDLALYPNTIFIHQTARTSSLQAASLLLGLSFISTIAVGFAVRAKLTEPLRKLADEFLKVDVSNANKLYSVDINYKDKDEIGLLIKKVNDLIEALQKQFMSEYALRKETEELQKRFRLLFEQSTAGIGLLGLDGKVSISNPAMNQLFHQNMEGQFLPAFFEDPAILSEHLKTLQDENSYSQLSVDLVSYRGNRKRYLHCLLSTIKESRKDVRESSDHLIEITIYDVTKRREIEHKARYEADHDSLTGLLNRRSGRLKLEELVSKCSVFSMQFALLMVDLDRFKPINDVHGHDVGDVVLKEVSKRILAHSSKVHSVSARWGGDEFLIGVAVNSQNELDEFSQVLLEEIQQDVVISEDLSVEVGASIGAIVFEPENDSTVEIEGLIRQADAAMYEIKTNGKNNYLLRKFNP